MIAHLSALVKRIAELRQAGLEVCHCIKEFHLRRIHPLGHQENLAFECPRLADPSRYPAAGETSTLPIHYCNNNNSNLACFIVQCSFVS
jgi:hypothetical protein